MNPLLRVVNKTSSEYSWISPEEKASLWDMALMETWSFFMPVGGDSETWSEAMTGSLTYVCDCVYVSVCVCVSICEPVYLRVHTCVYGCGSNMYCVWA